jgi:hypothetical protein
MQQQSLFADSDPTCSPLDSPVKTLAWLDAVTVWLETEAVYSSVAWVSLMNAAPLGFSSKTSLDFCQATEDGTWEPSCGRWGNAGFGGPGVCLTLSTTEWHSDGGVCSLSDILQSGHIPPEFFLTPKACQGILRRAEKRGLELPAQLKHALTEVASTEKDTTNT